jgi:hypothetical protein
MLWDVMFMQSITDIIVSNKQENANKNLGMIKFSYLFLPDWLKKRGPALTKSAEYRLEFTLPTGAINRVKSFAGTETAGAGETAFRVVADEFALLADPTNTFRTLMPTTDAGGSFIIISTARGAFNEFAKLYKGAKKGLNQFVPIFEPWTVSPFMNSEKYERYRRQFASEPWKFYSEYPSDDEEAFRESGNPRFTNLPMEVEPIEIVGSFFENERGDVEFEWNDEGCVFIRDLEPDPDLRYFLGGDPAQGRGGDFSTAQVMCIGWNGKARIVAMQTSNLIEPTEWAHQLSLMGRYYSAMYGPAMIAIEDQGGQGQLPINELQRGLEYPNAYVAKTIGRRRNGRSGSSNRIFSFPMTADRRRMVIDKLAEYLANDLIEGIHPALLEELHQFIRLEMPGGGVKYAADYGCHDDQVMSTAITLWMALENNDIVAPDMSDNGSQKVTFTKMQEIRDRNREAAKQAELDSWDAVSLGGSEMYVM